MPVIPSMIPLRNGQAFLNPKLSPVASKIVLFGPGVIEVVIANSAMENARVSSNFARLFSDWNSTSKLVLAFS